MKQFESPELELILLKGDVIVTSGTVSADEEETGENGGNW